MNTALQYSPADRFQTAEAMKEALLVAGRKTGLLARIPSVAHSPAAEGIKPLWTFKCEDEIRGTPSMDQGVIYLGSYDNNLYAVDATNGKLLWKFATEGSIVSRPVLADFTAMFGSEDNRFYAVSTRTKQLLWNFATEEPIRSSPAVSEGHVFFGSDDGYVYAVNLSTNRLSWRFEAGGPMRSSPVVAADHLYFGTELGDFYCLDFDWPGKVALESKTGDHVRSRGLARHRLLHLSGFDALCARCKIWMGSLAFPDGERFCFYTLYR